MNETKYIQLYRILKRRILSGEFRPGEKLPSKRTLADRSGYSLITVEHAYAMLEDEGYLAARPRRGYFVCAPDRLFQKPPATVPEPLHFLPEPDRLPPPPGFETSVWRKTVRRVLAEQGDRLFVKAPPEGCAVLRNALAAYLLRYRGMHADPRRIIVGSGAEQLYESIVKLLGRDRVYGVEDPSYEPIRAVYEDMGAAVCPLRLGPDGVRSEELTERRFDVLHVTPFHSFPTGVTASLAKRYEYLAWAAADDRRYVVEDDFDSEFFRPGHPIESLYSLDARRVLYLNTFSKSLSPSVRIGYMILPEELLPRYKERLARFSCSVPVMDQYVLAAFLADGSFERHLNRARRALLRSR